VFCFAKPGAPVPLVDAIADALTTGAVVSIVNVRVVTGDWRFDALSVARELTVYEPSAGKLEPAKPYAQLAVPVAGLQTCVALENELPFQ
jgi:hypothetical protein